MKAGYTVKIYRNNRTGKLFVLEEHVTQGSKICLVPMDRVGDEKFILPKSLKSGYTLWGEEQVLVELKAFTGMRLGIFKVAHYDKDKIQIWTKGDKLLEFDMHTEKQLNAKNPKFANKIGMVYGHFVPYWL